MKWRGFLVAVFALVIACGEGDGGSGSAGSGATNGTGGTGAGNGTGGSGANGGTFVPPADSYTVKWGPIDVPTGESTRCVVKRLGNPGGTFIHEIHNVLEATSHHLIVYRVNDTVEQLDPQPCDSFLDVLEDPPLMLTQKAEDRLTLPPGVAYELAPNQMVRLELHYINVSPAPLTAQATSTFIPMPADEVTNEANVMFMGDIGFDRFEGVATLGPTFIRDPRFNGANFFAITGHEHQWGTNVYVETTGGPGMPSTPVYDVVNFQWSEPETVEHDPPFTVPDGGGFNLTCEWNKTTEGQVGFGLGANDEMCFFWAYYYPSQGPVVIF